MPRLGGSRLRFRRVLLGVVVGSVVATAGGGLLPRVVSSAAASAAHKPTAPTRTTAVHPAGKAHYEGSPVARLSAAKRHALVKRLMARRDASLPTGSAKAKSSPDAVSQFAREATGNLARSQAQASPNSSDGEIVRSFNAAAPSCSVGTGLAFDGTALYMSCWYTSTLTAVSPQDGSFVASHDITGIGGIGALAWD